MFKNLFTKANKGFGPSTRLGAQARFLATIQNNTSRQMPRVRSRATPVSHERATFTIKVDFRLTQCMHMN